MQYIRGDSVKRIVGELFGFSLVRSAGFTQCKAPVASANNVPFFVCCKGVPDVLSRCARSAVSLVCALFVCAATVAAD